MQRGKGTPTNKTYIQSNIYKKGQNKEFIHLVLLHNFYTFFTCFYSHLDYIVKNCIDKKFNM